MLAGLGLLALIAIAFIYGVMTWGLVLFKFWGWFVLPVFSGMPEITYPMAIGLMLVIGLFHARDYTMIKDEYKDTKTPIVLMVIAPWLSLLFGVIVNGIWF